MQVLNLVKGGFGSFVEIKNLDSPDFLDLLEYFTICNRIELYEFNKARKK